MAARKPAKPKAAKPKAAKPKAAKPKAAKPKAAKPKTAKPKAAEPKAAEPKAPRKARKLPNPDAPRDQARATHAHPELRTLPEVRAYLAGVVDGRRRGRR